MKNNISELEIAQAYLDGFCGLVCPFPRLEVMRKNPAMITDNHEEFKFLCIQESKYNNRKYQAQTKFYRYMYDKYKADN